MDHGPAGLFPTSAARAGSTRPCQPGSRSRRAVY